MIYSHVRKYIPDTLNCQWAFSTFVSFDLSARKGGFLLEENYLAIPKGGGWATRYKEE